VFTVRLLVFGTGVYVADPQAIRELFTGDQSDLHAGEANAPLAPVVGDHSVLVLDGREHLRQRRLLLPPFQGSAIESFRNVIREVAEAEIARWGVGDRFTMRERMRAAHVRGDRPRDLRRSRARPHRTAASRADRVLDLGPVFFLPSPLRRDLGPRSPWGRFQRRLRAADVLIYDEIARRRGAADLDERADVLSLLLRARDEDGRQMTDLELRDELMTMLLAGHETTATGLALAFDLLLRDPRVLARLRDELTTGDDGYLDAVVSEALRLRPVIDATERTLTKPRTIAGWKLPAGIRVYPAIAVVQPRGPLPEPDRVPARTVPRRSHRVLQLAPVRWRHPPLHRRRARPGRDGRGDPPRRHPNGAAPRAPAARPGRDARHHARPAPRDTGRGRAHEPTRPPGPRSRAAARAARGHHGRVVHRGAVTRPRVGA